MKPAHHLWQRILVGALVLAFSGAGCSGFEPISDRRSAEGPRMLPGDRVYELALRVVDIEGNPLDDVRTQVRVIRYSSVSRETPQAEFTMFGLSGDGGEPGLIRYRFPASPDPRTFDVVVRTIDGREVPTSRRYFGQFWATKNHGGRKWDMRQIHNAHGFPETGEAEVEITFVTAG